MSRSYTHVPGFFLQDDLDAVPEHVGAVPPRLGLKDSAETRWVTFRRRIAEMNVNASAQGQARAAYKVFFLGRHGQGYHNLAEAKYGTEAWDACYSKLNGDDELTWGPDPLLTPLGLAQAVEAQEAWRVEARYGVPEPERHFLSPLKRALDTWKTTFLVEQADEGGSNGGDGGRRGLILEHCREEYGVHTCDLRSPRSHLETLYPRPTFDFEPDFAEHDPLWRAEEREAKAHIVERALSVLDRAFEDEGATYISITAHGGFINGFLNAVGRPAYALPTGGVLPVVVKRTFIMN